MNIEFPCAVGDTIYAISSCDQVSMYHDNDYETGTGAVECPFEDTCDIEECDDNHIRIFETECSGFSVDRDGAHIYVDFLYFYQEPKFGVDLFLNKDEAEKYLKSTKDYLNSLDKSKNL